MTSSPQVRSKTDWFAAYSKMLLARMCEEKIREEYFKDEMKTPVHLGIGGEAIACGVQASIARMRGAHAVKSNTKYFGTYRNHSIFLATSDDTDTFFGEMYGKVTGCGKGKAGSMHMASPEHGLVATSAVVGTTVPLAVGSALGDAVMGRDGLSIVFFGDGAMEEGAFYESVNFAALEKLPVLFVCEDNDLAIHNFRRNRLGWKSTKDMVAGFRCLYDEGDGTDLKEVMEKTDRMIAEMKKQNMPGFLSFNYYRFLEHVGPLEDFKFGYRAKADQAETKFDPIAKAEAFLKTLGVTDAEIEAEKKKHRSRIDESVKRAQNAPFPPPNELYADVWAEDTPVRYM